MAKSAEFILDFEAKQVLVLEPFGPYYHDVFKRLAEQKDLQVVECPSLQELGILARQVGVCLVVGHCNSEAEASGFIRILELCRKEILERKIRLVITVSKDFVLLQPRFVRAGASLVLQQPISPKLLYARLDRYLDILPSRNKYGKLIPPKPRQHGTGEDLSDEPVVTWQQPLRLKSDCWMPIDGKTRWTPGANKWTAALIGPPPEYGEWTESDSLPEDPARPVSPPPERTWEWIPSGLTHDPFVLEEGAWKFRGEKPEYKDGAWTFAGKHPKLAFICDGENQGTKFVGDENSLDFSENSPQVLKAVELIETALRNELKISNPVVSDAGSMPSSREKASEESPGATPDYLRRVVMNGSGGEAKALNAIQVNPLLAALLISEMAQSRKFTPEAILWNACVYLSEAVKDSVIELWVKTPTRWKCVQHDDLIDMALQQRLESATYEKMLRVGEQRAFVIDHEGERLGALVVGGAGGKAFSDVEIQGFGKVFVQVLATIARRSGSEVA